VARLHGAAGGRDIETRCSASCNTLEHGHILLSVLLEHGALWHRPACHGVAAGQDERIQAGEPLLAAHTLLAAVNFGYYTLCARLYKHQKY